MLSEEELNLVEIARDIERQVIELRDDVQEMFEQWNGTLDRIDGHMDAIEGKTQSLAHRTP